MSNSLDEVIPKLLAQGVLALRENCVMPRLVNSDYDTMAAQKGDTINVPIPSAIAVQDVAPSHVPPPGTDSAPTSAPIPLDKWKYADFYLTDKDKREAVAGIMPMQASEAIKALARQINSDIMALYKTIYGSVGTPGVVPFATDTSDATEARRILNVQLAPLDDRRAVIDPTAEANALNLRAFQDLSFSGSAQGIIEGKINRKLGFDWFMDQQVPSHTTGSQDGNYTTNAAGYALGVKQVTTVTGTGTILTGDVFMFDGDTQTYVATADMAAPGTLSFEPGLQVAIPTVATAITVMGSADTSYTQNLAFHRDCFAFASRPLADEEGLGNKIMSIVDNVSGIALRLEVSRQHRQVNYSYDILYGVGTVRRELGARIWGQ